MNRKRIILGASGIIVLLVFVALLVSRGNGDVSKVTLGFAGYGVTNGKPSLILIVTNGSSYRISQPGWNYELSGESLDGLTMVSTGTWEITCSFRVPYSPNWESWQLKLPNIPSIASGGTYRFTVPVDDGPYTWRVTVPLTTIPFKDRLPYALRTRLPSSKKDAAISFKVTSPPIPSAASRKL